MRTLLKKLQLFTILPIMLLLFCSGNMVFASDGPSIQIHHISYSDSLSRELNYDFTSGTLQLYDLGGGESLTLFLPESSVIHPDDKTFSMSAWNAIENAMVNNLDGYLEFSIPFNEDCLSENNYGSFVLNQGYDQTPADEFHWNIKLNNFKNFNKDQSYYMVSTAFSTRWDYYNRYTNELPTYRGYLQLLVSNGYSSSGYFQEGTLLARILIKRQIDDSQWQTKWEYLGDDFDFENIKIDASFQGSIINGVQKIRATCTVNSNETVVIEINPDNLDSRSSDIEELIKLDMRPFSGLSSVTSLEMGCLKSPDTINISMDIKPGSCSNPLNINSKGVLPVAILGNEGLNVTDIDIASIRLNGVPPIRSSIEDVTMIQSCDQQIRDGYDDLILKFKTQEIVTTLGDVEDGEEINLTLEANLTNGTTLNGVDIITIIKKGKW